MRSAARFFAVSLFTAACLSAGVVNFAALSEDGSGNSSLLSTYSQGGLTFGSSNNDLFVRQRSNVDHPSGGDAATSLVAYFAGSTVTFSATDSSPFSISFIDLAQLSAGQGTPGNTFAVDFTGHLHGGGTVTDTFNVFLTSGPNLQTFTFSSGFINLDSVSFVQGAFAEGKGIQFNNIVTDINGVPEPSTLGLLAVGLLLALPSLRKIRAS